MATFGIFVLEGIVLPLIFYLFLRKAGPTENIPFSVYLKLYIIGVVVFPILLPRKHLEYWLVTKNSSFLFVLLVVQMINNIFEELGKALVFCLGAKGVSRYSTSLSLGLYAGMAYGIGEAFTLSIIGMKPVLGKFFGINLTLLFMTWWWVLERFYAILIHAVMGGFVGLSLYFLKKSAHIKAISFFLLAILYHELVDGMLIYAHFHPLSPLSGFLMKHIYDVFLPVLTLSGIGGIFILWRKKEVVI